MFRPRLFSRPAPSWGRSHDAAAGAGDHHQVALGELCSQLAGKGIDRVTFRGAGRAEYRDLAAPLELLQHAEGVLHFAQGLQHDLGVPAIAVGLGHAHHGDQHLAIECEVGAVAGNGEVDQLVDLLGQVDSAGLEVPGEKVVRIIGHSVLLAHQHL